MSTHRLSARLRWAVTVTAGAAASLVALTGSATGAPSPVDTAKHPITITDPVPAGFTSWDEVNAVQSRLSAVSDRIHEAAALPDGAGFGSIIAEPAAHRLRLFWKGAVPSSVRALLTKDPRVSVTVERAAFSELELRKEIDRLVSAKPVGLDTNTTQFVGAGPLPDASGLKMFVTGSAASGRDLSSVRAATVPVTVESAPLPQVATRANDSSPYYGGANWTSLGNCTTGFAVDIAGVSKMLSARHCATDTITTVTTAVDGGGDFMGTATLGASPMLDSVLINASSAGQIFNGGPGAGEFINPVIGRHFNDPGFFVCTSGAFSGTRCNIRIMQSGVTQSFSQGPGKPIVTFNNLSIAEQQDRLNAGGNGDSGGPVFEVDTDPSRVWAKGTITGTDGFANPVTCTGVPASSTRACSWRIWYTSVTQSMNAFGATIKVAV